MRIKSEFLAFGLAALLAAPSATLPTAFAQEATPAPTPSPDTTVKRKVRTRVVPEYPLLAKEMDVSGKVRLEATIATDGHVTSTRAIGGSPLLVIAATEALKRWRFEPAPKESTEIIEFEFGN